MKPQTIYLEASESDIKSTDFLIAETKISHTPTVLAASAIDLKLIETERYVFTETELKQLLRDAFDKGEEGKSFRNHLINLGLEKI